MTDAGRAAVEAARADGRWDAAYAGPATRQAPDDLAAAIAAEPDAKAMFDVLTSANRFALIHRVESMKRVESRTRKITEMVEMLAAARRSTRRRRVTPDGRGKAPTPGTKVAHDQAGVSDGVAPDARREATPRHVGSEGWSLCKSRQTWTQAGRAAAIRAVGTRVYPSRGGQCLCRLHGAMWRPLPPRTHCRTMVRRDAPRLDPAPARFACPSESEFGPASTWGRQVAAPPSAVSPRTLRARACPGFPRRRVGRMLRGIAEWVHAVDPRRDGALGDEGGHHLELGSRLGDNQHADSLSGGTTHQRAGDRGAQQDPGLAAHHRVPPAAPQGAVHAERRAMGHEIHDQVEAVALVGPVLSGEVDRVVGPDLAQEVGLVGSVDRRHLGTGVLGQCDNEDTAGAARAVDQNPISRPDIAVALSAMPPACGIVEASANDSSRACGPTAWVACRRGRQARPGIRPARRTARLPRRTP